jgi:hypothetical protein
MENFVGSFAVKDEALEQLLRQAASLQHQAISMRAHEVFVALGGGDGHDLQDWLTAEREFVNARSAAVLKP